MVYHNKIKSFNMRIVFTAAFLALATEAILLLDQPKQPIILFNHLAQSDAKTAVMNGS